MDIDSVNISSQGFHSSGGSSCLGSVIPLSLDCGREAAVGGTDSHTCVSAVPY